MADSEVYDERRDIIRTRFDALQEFIDSLPEARRDAMAEALNAVGVSLEELQVAEEELRQQNEELYEMQQQLQAQRQRYQDLFEFAPDGYFVTDTAGLIREANRAADELFEVRAGSLINQPITDFVDEDKRADFEAALAQLSRDGYIREWHVKMCSLKGKRFDADIRVAPTIHITPTNDIPDHAGRLNELRWLVRDVTERSLAEERIRMSERQLADAQQIAHVGSWHWDIANNIVTWSDELYRIYGVTRSGRALSYEDFLKRVHPDDRERVSAAITNAYRDRAPFMFDHRIVRPDNSVRILHARGEVVVDEKGNPTLMLGAGQDVTESREAEQQIRQLNEQLEQRVAERTAQLQAANEELKHEINERRQVEQALRRSEEIFRALVENAPDLIVRFDRALRCLYASPRLERATGLTPDALVGKTYRDVGLPENLCDLWDKALHQVLQTGKSAVLKFEFNGPKGLRTYQAHVGPEYGEDGLAQTALAMVRDVTEQEQMQAALRESEARFRQLANTAPVLIWMSGTDRLHNFFNKTWLSFTGHSMEQEMGQGWTEGIHPDDLGRYMDTYTSAFDARESFRMEYRLRHADGQYRWLLDNGMPRFTPGGVFIGYIGSCVDITDRKQGEHALLTALERTRELYQISRLIALVRTPADVLHALTLSNYLRRINRAAILLFDQPWQDQAPSSCTALASWRGRSDLLSIEGRTFPLTEYGFDTLFAHDQPVQIEDVQTHPDLNEQARALFARLQTRSVILFPLVASGQWYGMLSLHAETPGVVGDEDVRHMRGLADQAAVAIYNIRLLEAEARARHEAEVANDLKLKFLAMISHELRTPLTSIKGFATTLLAPDVTWDQDAQHEFISTINQEADKLTEMIEQLLDLSRMQAGTLRINAQPLPFGDILSTAMAQLQTITQQHHFTIDIPTGLPPVQADRQRIAQVVTNLVDNAAKYSPRQSSITLSARLADNWLEISVRDEGAGIPEQDRQSVFQVFHRGEGENTLRTKGAGLGLAICKHLIEAHGGRIWVQDHPGPGTLMTFTLPLA